MKEIEDAIRKTLWIKGLVLDSRVSMSEIMQLVDNINELLVLLENLKVTDAAGARTTADRR